MVGSGATSDRSKEAVGMMALHEALRTVCLNSDWTYSVFWTIRPRPYTSLSLSLSTCFYIFSYLCVYVSVFSTGSCPFLAEELEVVMAARLVMITAACKCLCITPSFSNISKKKKKSKTKTTEYINFKFDSVSYI